MTTHDKKQQTFFPVIKQPIFTTVLPSTGKKVRYRQFTVKEEKVLMTAQATTDDDGNPEQEAVVQAFKQLINNCALDKIDIEALTTFDIEWFFIQLRSKSVGNVIELEIDPPKSILDEFMVEEEEGEKKKKKPIAKIKLSVNLDDVKCSKPTISNKIVLSAEQGIGVMMRYPTFEMIASMTDDDDPFSLIEKCIVSIFDGNGVYPTADAEPGDLRAWFDDLNDMQRQLMQSFLEDAPFVFLDIEYVTHDLRTIQTRLRGIDAFFQ